MFPAGKRALIQKALLDGRAYKDIASELRVSFRDIAKIKNAMGEPSEPSDLEIIDKFADGQLPNQVILTARVSPKRVAELWHSWVDICVDLKRYLEVEEAVKPVIAKSPALKEVQKKHWYLCSSPKCRARITPLDYESQSCPDCGLTGYWKELSKEEVKKLGLDRDSN